jgi:hypothetical protein
MSLAGTVGKNGTMEHARAELIEILREHGARFGFVFGSRARGDHRLTSDLDVAAWWPGEAPSAWDVVMPPGVDLVVLNGAPLELAGRVALEGEVLFDDDPAAQVFWTATTRKFWLDERPRSNQLTDCSSSRPPMVDEGRVAGCCAASTSGSAGWTSNSRT